MAPVICGFLIQSKGWRWFHWLVSILASVNVLLIFFLVPETQYRRDLHKSMDSTAAGGDGLGDLENSPSSGHSDEDNEIKTNVVNVETTASSAITRPEPTRKTHLEEIKPWSGVRRDTSLLAAYIRPWAMWTYPSMVWAVFAFSLHVSW